MIKYHITFYEISFQKHFILYSYTEIKNIFSMKSLLNSYKDHGRKEKDRDRQRRIEKDRERNKKNVLGKYNIYNQI